MDLTIKDRLCIPVILPKEGNFRQFNHKKEILRKIEIDDATREEVGLKENKESNRLEWDIEKDKPIVVDLTSDEVAYLKESCEAISDQILPDDMWSVVEKIYNSIQE